jgi:hypothetical protein
LVIAAKIRGTTRPMSKEVTRLPTGMRRPIEAVKKSLRNSVNLVIDSENEDLIRTMEGVFEYMFKNVYMFKDLVGPKDLYREKGEVIPIQGDKAKPPSV